MRLPVLSNEIFEMDTSRLTYRKVRANINNYLQYPYQVLRSVLQLQKKTKFQTNLKSYSTYNHSQIKSIL